MAKSSRCQWVNHSYNYRLNWTPLSPLPLFIGEPTGTSVSPASPLPQSFTAKPTDKGLDTINELRDKEKFFHDVEGGASPVDYNKKLGEMSTSYSVTGNTQNR